MSPLPASPETVSHYLADAAENGYRAATITRWAAAPCAALLDEKRAQDHRPQGAAAALVASEQAIDQQPQSTLQLEAIRRLGKVERFRYVFGCSPWMERMVGSAGELVGLQTSWSKPISQSGGGKLGEFTERPNSQALQRLGQVCELGTCSKQGHRHRGQESPGLPLRAVDDHRPAHASPGGRRHGGKA